MKFYKPKVCPPFYESLRNKMNENNISRTMIFNNTQVKSSHFVDWKSGADPNIVLVYELAKYMKITIDELVGRDRSN